MTELRGTRTVNAVDGVASFSGLAVERAGSGFKVLASAGELESAESEAFAIEPGAPAGLAFLNEPEEVVAGDTFTVRVEVRDAWGNPVPTATGRVALSLAAAPEDAGLGGVLEADVVEGLADFGPVLERADSAYVLAVAGSGLEGAKSGRFRVVPAAPKQLAFIDLPDSIYAGEEHTYRVGVVDAFGNRVLGVDSVRVTIESDTLMMVDGEVAYTHTILSARNGTLFATAPDEGWGTARAEPVMILNWREIVSGHDRACGISTYSVPLCWGNSTRGRLGTGGGSQSIPVHVVGNRRWRSVAVGRDHTCAIEVGGTAYCWGGNAYGQLGINDPSIEYVTEPTKVDTNQRFAEITAGQYHTCAVTTVTYRVLCWGRNDLDQLGSVGGDAYAPRPVDSDLEFRKIVAGWRPHLRPCAARARSAAMSTAGGQRPRPARQPESDAGCRSGQRYHQPEVHEDRRGVAPHLRDRRVDHRSCSRLLGIERAGSARAWTRGDHGLGSARGQPTQVRGPRGHGR